MTIRRLDAGVVAIVLAAGLLACGRGPAPTRDAVGEALADGKLTARQGRGQRLFAVRCAMCHGALGHGDGQNASRMSPSPPDMSVTLERISSTDRRRIVIEGSAAVGRSNLCPPRGGSLRPEEGEALLAWLEVAARPAPEAPEASGSRRRRRPVSR